MAATFTLAKLKLTQRKAVIIPELYLKASGEILFIEIVLGAFLTSVTDPAFIENNPVRDLLGYNNFCVYFDQAPGLQVAAVLHTLTIYCLLEYNRLDSLRTVLSYATKRRQRFAYFANASYALSSMIAILIFVISPLRDSVIAHSLIFLQIIPFRFLMVLANFYEAGGTTVGVPKKSWIFLVCYGFFSLFVLIGAFVDIIALGNLPAAGSTPAFPPVLLQCFDYCWFVCLPLTGCFLPPSYDIRETYALVATGGVEMPDGEYINGDVWNSQVAEAPLVGLSLLFHLEGQKSSSNVDDDTMHMKDTNILTASTTTERQGEQGQTKKIKIEDIPCPVVALLYNNEMIVPDPESGKVSWFDIAKGAAALGVGVDILVKVFKTFSRKLTAEQKAGGINLFGLKETKLNHGFSTGIRDPTVNASKLEELLLFADKKMSGGGSERRMYARNFHRARDHYLAQAKANGEGDLGFSSSITAAVDFVVMVEAFGRSGDSEGRYLTEEDLRRLYIDSNFPQDFVAHRFHKIDLIDEVSVILCGCNCCPSWRSSNQRAKIEPIVEENSILVEE